MIFVAHQYSIFSKFPSVFLHSSGQVSKFTRYDYTVCWTAPIRRQITRGRQNRVAFDVCFEQVYRLCTGQRRSKWSISRRPHSENNEDDGREIIWNNFEPLSTVGMAKHNKHPSKSHENQFVYHPRWERSGHVEPMPLDSRCAGIGWIPKGQFCVSSNK